MAYQGKNLRCPSCDFQNVSSLILYTGMECPRCGKDKLKEVE